MRYDENDIPMCDYCGESCVDLHDDPTAENEPICCRCLYGVLNRISKRHTEVTLCEPCQNRSEWGGMLDI